MKEESANEFIELLRGSMLSDSLLPSEVAAQVILRRLSSSSNKTT